ncbi:MAG: glycosyltransferase family 2 protein [Ginsengibacter sp.]
MKSTPLISVITAFLNPGTWLNEAVESVIAQTCTNWELILVNDGSVQADSEIALQYAERFPNKIKYVEHPGRTNKGLPVSRNAGISKSSGEFIAVLDADDLWLPEKLQYQLDLFAQMPEVQMICEPAIFWYSWADRNAKDELFLLGAPEGVYQPPALMKLLYPLGTGQPPCPSGMIIKKEALERCGGFQENFSGVFQLYEDQAFFSKVYSAEVIYFSEKANNYYRKRENSMSSEAANESTYQKVRLYYAAWLRDYLSQSNQSDPGVIKLLNDFQESLLTEG